MTTVNMTITSPLTKAQWESIVPMPAAIEGALNLSTYFRAMAGGAQEGTTVVNVGAVSASATLTIAGTAGNNETFVVNGVTFTAKTGTASGNQFTVGTSATTEAIAIVNSVNASTSVKNQIVASRNGTVVTFTALHAGVPGNGYSLATSLANSTASGAVFTGGDNGNTYTLNLS